MSARKSKVVKVNISAGTYKDEAEAVREANAIKRWLIRYCDKNGYSIKGKVWISTNSAYAGRIINKGRKKEYKPNGKPLPTVVEAHIHMVLFCNPASTIVDALKSYLNKKHMKAVVWDRHCNSRAEVENAVEYATRQSRKVRTIDYDRKDILSVDEWGYYEAVERAESKIKDNMAFTKSEPEQTPETLENKSVSSITDTPETLTYKSIKYNYLYYYIVPTSYSHSIIKALLQDIIYYGRESSRSSCSKIIFKKVLLKVPQLLKNIKLCAIMYIIKWDLGGVFKMTNDMKIAVQAIVDSTICSFAEGLKSRYIDEVDDPNGVINQKKNNCFIAELGTEFMFYSAFVRSFDSSFGNVLEKMGNNIAKLFYTVNNEIESFILPEQTQHISNIMASYDRHTTPETWHYDTQNFIIPRDTTSFQQTHQTDNYFYDSENKTHFVIELKAGGDLDNKKSKAEKIAMLTEYYLLKNKVPTDEQVKIHFATAYNKFGEGNTWNQARVKQFFAQEELLIGKDYWNFVCKDENGFDIIFEQYKQSANYIKNSLAEIKRAYF